jgi:hypothetical protein
MARVVTSQISLLNICGRVCLFNGQETSRFFHTFLLRMAARPTNAAYSFENHQFLKE